MNKIEGQTCFMRYANKGERSVARKLVAALLERGCTINVSDGFEVTVRSATTAKTVLDALCTTGEDVLYARRDGARVATFHLIWGNDPDGSELIADYGGGEEAELIVASVTGEG
jgi:hypothetical protein